MTLQNRLDNLYPRADDIPEQFRAGPAIEQREYLVNGELRQWQGPLAPVLSPVSLKTDAGLESVVLGSTPLNLARCVRRRRMDLARAQIEGLVHGLVHPGLGRAGAPAGRNPARAA